MPTTLIRAVLFDAVGTVLHPEPSAAAVYAEYGQRFGSRLEPRVLRERFLEAFTAEEEFDATRQHRTDEQRERERWWRIVTRVLDDVREPGPCFDALYAHFERPSAWRIEPGAREVLQRLSQSGRVVGLASNFDHRLRTVVEGLTELPSLPYLFISSEVGWKKPAREFFEHLTTVLNLSPSEILFVGDDAENDYEGARRAGMQALLFDPKAGTDHPERISRLEGLFSRIAL